MATGAERVNPSVCKKPPDQVKTTRLSIVAGILCFAVCIMSSDGVAFAETKVLQGFTLIDGNGRRPVSPAAMIVTDGRIQWVGSKAQLKMPAGAETIDLTGKFV